MVPGPCCLLNRRVAGRKAGHIEQQVEHKSAAGVGHLEPWLDTKRWDEEMCTYFGLLADTVHQKPVGNSPEMGH